MLVEAKRKSRLWAGILDARPWILDTGYWLLVNWLLVGEMQDARYWLLDVGY